MCNCGNAQLQTNMWQKPEGVLRESVPCVYSEEQLTVLLEEELSAFETAVVKSAINLYAHNCNKYLKSLNKIYERLALQT